MLIKIYDKYDSKIAGRVGIQHGHGDTLETFVPIEPLVMSPNIFTTEGYNLLAEVLGGNFENAQVAFIDIGDQGDYDNGINTGVRVPPTAADTGVRNSIFRKAVLDFSYSGSIAVFKSLLKPFEGNSTNIDEFALLSSDQRAYSHVVTPEQFVGGPATKITKNSGLHALLVYELEFMSCP